VYLGGQQFVPFDVTHVIIDKSVKIIPERAFFRRTSLVSVETHDGIEKIGKYAFLICTSLRGIKLPGIKEIETDAFHSCTALTDVEFGDKLETIGQSAFSRSALRSITISSVRTIGGLAFSDSDHLTDVELPAIERIEQAAFTRCPNLRRIAIPLKDNMFQFDSIFSGYEQYIPYSHFGSCENLAKVELVGGIHKIISSLLLESWRDEMNQEIDRINQVLPKSTSVYGKTDAIRLWIRSVLHKMEHYKAEHNRLLKEDMTLLELAVWKAKLDEGMIAAHSLGLQPTKKVKIDVDANRKEQRITSGADIIIKNVLPFLKLG
jgi:hypothetical protein